MIKYGLEKFYLIIYINLIIWHIYYLTYLYIKIINNTISYIIHGVLYYYIKRDACRKSGRPCRKPDNGSRNWSNTSYNYAKSPKFSGNFGRNPEFSRKFSDLGISLANFPENWCFGILPEPRNFPEIGASGGRLNRDFWQNNSHRNT